ncbi:hypothetical protein BDR07DRAFT_1415271 [Suillus spraguei]|nr:hypothetical protein BDR07DRAFT_1415271 [Suillus spraguei]
MTVLYLAVRTSCYIYWQVQLFIVSLTDAVSNIMNYTSTGYMWSSCYVGVIMIARLYAMYQRSRIMLIFLVILSVHICVINLGDSGFCLNAWVLVTVWEVLALCLSVFIAVKHLRDLRRYDPSTGSTIGDCFKYDTLRCLQILSGVQMFVLGPRLILSVREYHAKLVVNSDADTSMNSIVFQERVHISTSSTV